jgi:hypothetical protein
MKIYYKIWVDLLYLKMKNPTYSDDWKVYIQIAMMLLMCFNLATIVISLRFLGYKAIFPKILALPSGKLGDFLFSAIYLFWPLLALNYFLIFYKDRYKKLMIKYTDSKGWLASSYITLSFVLFFTTFIFYVINQ